VDEGCGSGEICGNMIDDNGDGGIDEDCPEQCGNAMDDNGNGLQDLNDLFSDCSSCLLDSYYGGLRNGDFESFVYCPSGSSQIMGSLGWFPAEYGTADYFHTCGYYPTAGLNPFPTIVAPSSGQGFVGFHRSDYPTTGIYKEHVMTRFYPGFFKNHTYQITGKIGFGNTNSYAGETLQSLPSFTIAAYGTIGDDIFCIGTNSPSITNPISHRLLASTTVTGANEWVPFALNFTLSENMLNYIILGPDEGVPLPNIKDYHYLDAVSITYSLPIIQALGSSLCTGGVTLSVSSQDNTFSYKWYKNNILIPFANNPTYTLPSNTNSGDVFVCQISALTSSPNPGGLCMFSLPFSVLNDCTFPITLSSFKAENVNNQSTLSWKTSTELNASHFEIERAAEPNLFQKIGNVDAKGAGLYVYEDNSPSQGLNLYRLKMLDLDGSFAYSSVIDLNFENTLQASLFPNPADNLAVLSFFEEELNADIFVSNALGQVVYKNSLPPSVSIQNIYLNVQGWSKGVYFVHLENTKYKTVLKLIVE